MYLYRYLSLFLTVEPSLFWRDTDMKSAVIRSGGQAENIRVVRSRTCTCTLTTDTWLLSMRSGHRRRGIIALAVSCTISDFQTSICAKHQNDMRGATAGSNKELWNYTPFEVLSWQATKFSTSTTLAVDEARPWSWVLFDFVPTRYARTNAVRPIPSTVWCTRYRVTATSPGSTSPWSTKWSWEFWLVGTHTRLVETCWSGGDWRFDYYYSTGNIMDHDGEEAHTPSYR